MLQKSELSRSDAGGLLDALNIGGQLLEILTRKGVQSRRSVAYLGGGRREEIGVVNARCPRQQ